MPDILRRARGDKDPFGGVKLIMVGDLFQLPPVIKEDFFREIYDTSYFFSSKSLMQALGMEMVSFLKKYIVRKMRNLSASLIRFVMVRWTMMCLVR